MDSINTQQVKVPNLRPKGILCSGTKQSSHRRGVSFSGLSESSNNTSPIKINEITKHERAIGLNNDGHVFFRNGEYMDAIQNYQDALKLFISVHGEEHITVATTIGNIGNVYWKMGNLREAISQLENSLRILGIVSKKDGDDTLEICNTLHSVGIVYYLLGNIDKALATFTRELNSRTVLYGENSVDVARTLDAIGSVYLQKGCSSDAIEYFQDALRIKQALPNTSTNSLVISLKNLANALRVDQQYQKALSLYEEILIIQIADDSSSYFMDKDIGESFHIIGNIHMQLMQHNSAMKNFMKALERYKRYGLKKNDDAIIELKKSMMCTVN